MKTTKRNQNIFKDLKIKGNYNDFNDFYDENKELIYKSIIELFHEFKKTRKQTLTLYVSANIKGLEWDTEFNFTKNELFVLKRDLMPFFEDNEDYETCSEIISLSKDLTK